MFKNIIPVVVLILLSLLVLSNKPYQSDIVAKQIEVRETVFKPFNSQVVFTPQDKSNEYVLVKGILTSRAKDGVWYQCGLKIPEEQWHSKAVEVARACITSAKPYGIDPVGQLATWQQESRLDPCAIGVGPRKWALRHGLLKAKKTTISYTKEEVKKVLENPWFQRNFKRVDLGLAQLLYPAFTRDATVDEILSMEGAKYSAIELDHRSKMWRTDEPWITWQGNRPESKAKRKAAINRWVYKVMEINYLR